MDAGRLGLQAKKTFAHSPTMMLLMGMKTSLTKKPTKPIAMMPIDTRIPITWYSARGGKGRAGPAGGVGSLASARRETGRKGEDVGDFRKGPGEGR